MMQLYPVTHNNSAHRQPLASESILVVEDDPDIANLIRLHLAGTYQNVDICHDGIEAYRMARENSWELLVINSCLPNKNGLELCRDLRANQFNMPIVMLSNQSSEIDRVLGLEMGADDYITKPFGLTELTARVKAILRRSTKTHTTVAKKRPIREIIHSTEHNLTLDTRLRKLAIAGKDITLTAKEFDLMLYFLQNPGTIFSREHLLNEIWGYSHQCYEHTVNSHISRLRAKIERDPASPKMIITKWGVGYQFNDSQGTALQ